MLLCFIALPGHIIVCDLAIASKTPNCHFFFESLTLFKREVKSGCLGEKKASSSSLNDA